MYFLFLSEHFCSYNGTNQVLTDPHISLLSTATEAIKILRWKNWLYHEYCVPDSRDGQKRWGLVFADPERLKKIKTLARRGNFDPFDATHKLNNL